MENTPLKSTTPPLAIWWLIWGGITAAFFVVIGIFETGGFLALILGSPWKTPLAAAAIVLIIVHIPAFIRRH